MNFHLIIIIIIFISLILLFYYSLYHKNIENFSNNNNSNLIFVDRGDMIQILFDDKDNYYNRFFINDFKVRNINNIDEYKEFIRESVSELNDDQKKLITKAYNELLKDVSKITRKWINIDNLKSIPFKIGFVKGKKYEYGLPHTRSDYIIISDIVLNYEYKEFKKTLLHEWIHIYQKKYPNDVEIFLDEFDFKRFKRREENDNVRANPDLDDYNYKNKKGDIMKAVYKKKCKNIEDVDIFPENEQKCEHPFENMAIECENLI